jgi:precorrin-2 dehydrogenase / sirohydrochlorin ferrochelatase
VRLTIEVKQVVKKSGHMDQPISSGNVLFPVFLKLENLNLLIVGGGFIGMEKVSAVLRNSPATKLTLVAIHIAEEIKMLVQSYPNVELIEREYRSEDLNGKDVVIVALDNRPLAEVIQKETKARHLLINVADKPDLCDFYLGSIVKKGDLKIGISTNGKSPTLAKRIREFLEDILPDNISEFLDRLQQIRNNIKGDFEEKIKVLDKMTSAFLKKENK